VSRRLVFAAACLSMLTFGVVLTVLGALLPSLIARFGLDKASAGALFPLLTLGVLGGALVFGPVVDRYGFKWMLAAATAVIAIGLEALAFAPSLAAVRVAIVLIGLGGGVVNGGTNALVADISADGRTAGISILGVFFGVGAVGVPFALGTLLRVFDYQSIIAGVGVLVLCPALFAAATRFPDPKHAQAFPIAEAARLVRDPVLLLMGLMLFLESGMEITVGGWTATFFQEELGLAADDAIVYLSLYWLGMMLARLALGSILRRIMSAQALMGGIVIAVLGSALLIATHTVMLAAAGVFLLGVGFAATYPIILGYVADRYAHLSGTAFSVVIVIALLGGTAMPYLSGVLGSLEGLRTSFLIVPTSLVMLGSLLGVVTRRLRTAPAAA